MNLKILILLALLLVPLSLADSSIDINYAGDSDTISEDIESQDVLVKITTSLETTCRYDFFSGVNYSNMTGRFDITNSKMHKKTFLNLSDGGHKFYFKCSNMSQLEPKEVILDLNIDSLIYGEIDLSKDAPLSSGGLEIKLTTSKVPRLTPELTYFIDGEEVREIVLEGSGTNWEGRLLLEKSLGEAILSFDFKAEDLEGRSGDTLVSGKVFEIDTTSPLQISEFEAIPEENQIKLSWHIEEEIEKINIYRSTSQDVGHISFYKSTRGSLYLDKNLENGTTYYYRISAVDSAGNEGELSEEKYSSILGFQESSTTSLSPILMNDVNSFLSKLASLTQSISDTSVLNSELTSQEKDLLSIVGLDKKSDSLLSEVTSIKNIAEGYKSQDLSKEDLDAKLSSLNMKLKVIQKEFPTSITIVEEHESDNSIDEDLIRETLYKYDQSLSEEINDNSIKTTLDLIENENLKIHSWHGLIQIGYYDTSKDEFSITKRTMSSTLELMEDAAFLEVFPAELYESFDKLEFKNRNAEKLSDKEMVSLDSSTKSITYYLPGNQIKNMQNIKPVFIAIAKEEVVSKGITGYFIFNSASSNNSMITIFGVMSLALLTYFLILKKQNSSENYLQITSGLNNILSSMKEKDVDSAKMHYKSIQKNYPSLDDKEKKKIYPKLDSAKAKILVAEFENELVILGKTKNKKMLPNLEKKYSRLPENVKVKIGLLFTKIKNEIDRE